MSNHNRCDDARELLQNIEDVTYDLDTFFRHYGSRWTYERWKQYCMPAIMTAIRAEHEWVGGNMFNAEDLIDEIDIDEEEDEEDKDETENEEGN